ncbi:MAG: SPW repeat protein [Patescibacteria group bacterium]
MRSIYWLQLIIGIWVLVSPWALGYAYVTPALWNAIICGVLISLSSFWGLFGEE